MIYFKLKSSSKNIFKIGVTGGIGSGKSTVCSIFESIGVPVLYADDIAKDISSSDSIIRKNLITLLGILAFQTDGSLNRSFIASKIFFDKSLRQKIEAIIHPRVEKEILRRIKEEANRGQSIVIVEAALIYEVGLDKKLDSVVVVDAEESECISRVCKRDAVSKDEVRSRIASQLDVKKKLEKADYIIFNKSTLEELESKVRFLYILFKQLADEVSCV